MQGRWKGDNKNLEKLLQFAITYNVPTWIARALNYQFHCRNTTSRLVSALQKHIVRGHIKTVNTLLSDDHPALRDAILNACGNNKLTAVARFSKSLISPMQLPPLTSFSEQVIRI